jgi:hypothetical protein
MEDTTMTKRFRIATLVFIAVGAVCAILPPKDYAYIDPSTGSYVLQLLIAALLAGALAARKYRTRIKALVAGLTVPNGCDGSRDGGSHIWARCFVTYAGVATACACATLEA